MWKVKNEMPSGSVRAGTRSVGAQQHQNIVAILDDEPRVFECNQDSEIDDDGENNQPATFLRLSARPSIRPRVKLIAIEGRISANAATGSPQP